MKKALIIYDCDPDGIAAAITVGHSLEIGEESYDIQYERAVRYQAPNWELIDQATTVFIVDFNYNAEITRELCLAANDVIVIDHHKTAREELADLATCDELHNLTLFIHENHSACVNAWTYFHADAEAPEILRYIEDMDLWKWELDDSVVVSAYLDSVKASIETYRPFIIGQVSLDSLFDAGAAVKAYKDKTIDVLVKQAVVMEIGGHKVRAVNCADPSIVSYLGNVLAKDAPFGATWYLQPNGLFKFSVRSITDDTNPQGVDVSEIAKVYGGGGHSNASGFKVNVLFPFAIIKDMEVSR